VTRCVAPAVMPRKVVSLPQLLITPDVDRPLLNGKHWPVCASHRRFVHVFFVLKNHTHLIDCM
jgi:hypothetical protein